MNDSKHNKSEVLKRLRNTKGLTHEQVAEKAGISRSTYTKVEGGRSPNVKNAKKLAKVLGFNWHDLY